MVPTTRAGRPRTRGTRRQTIPTLSLKEGEYTVYTINIHYTRAEEPEPHVFGPLELETLEKNPDPLQQKTQEPEPQKLCSSLKIKGI